MLDRIGVEPSGEPFNAISVDPSGRPANPMISAGAIVTTSLVLAADADERFRIIRAGLSAFAGRPLELTHDVYASESATGDPNRGLAHLARASGGEIDFVAAEQIVHAPRRWAMRARADTASRCGIRPVSWCHE